MRTRLRQAPHPVVAKELIAAGIDADSASFGNVVRLNQVHAVLLDRAGIVSREQAQALLRVYDELARMGPGGLEFDLDLEDIHLNVETFVIGRLGRDVGGRMHTGRSRNDLNATMARLQARERIVAIVERAIALRQTLHQQAARHAASVMTGYTHSQPAQPITLGYYLGAVSDALGRDVRRVMRAYDTANFSPLGAGALAGSGYALDRHLASRLLGFAGLVENSLDAVASRDYLVELAAALAGLAVTISRLAQELYVWASDEYGFVEFGDDVCIVSSIMPQKKNPITLEHCKSKAGHVVGALVAALMATHAAPFTNNRDGNRELPAAVARSLAETDTILQLMTATLAGMTVHTGRMLDATRANFSTMTELADLLVREYGVPFRAAHELVASLVLDTVERNLRSDAIAPAEVVHRARQALGITVDEADVRRALDPRQVLEGRATTGSPAPRHVRAMLRRGRSEVRVDERWIARQRASAAAADGELQAEVVRVLAYPDGATPSPTRG
jgi:argininosuccinate lyase